ncbi:MAG: extracellular solute-binding protein [Actinomycetota bacterium]
MLPTSTRSPWRRWLAALLVLVLIAAACGDSDDGDADADTAAATETTGEAAADDSDETATAEAATDETEAPASDDGGDGGGDGEQVTIRWFVGLGTGSQPEQIEAQEAIVARFNETHPNIDLQVEFVDNEVANDTLATQIAGGNAPDIIGPVGIRGSNAFAGEFLDLEPLVEASGFDLSVYDPAQVEFWREDDGTLTALPFGVFPSFIYYNTELFDEAGLAYPPHELGEPYADGDPWDMDKLAELAAILTVDANGNDATSPDFDRDDVVQFGFTHQWGDDARAQGSFFGGGSFVADDGSAQIPEHWLAQWQWHHDLIWETGAAPNQSYLDSELLNAGNTFTSGNMGMVFTHLWYTCCVRDDDGNGKEFFDIAVAPSYEGTTTSKLHADIFRILDSTEHQEEAFEVLQFLLSDAAGDLLNIYGGMPARGDLQDAFFEGLDETFPQGVDWEVARASLAIPDEPSHEGNMPAFLEAEARIDQFESLIASDPDLDLEAEAESLRADLDVIFTAG